MATSKKTIVVSPKKRVVKRVPISATDNAIDNKMPRKRTARKNASNASVNNETSETIIAPSIKVKKPTREEVVLPSNASLRSQNKANALSDFIEHLEQPFFVIAYVSAVCFIVVGMSFIASSHLNNSGSQLAQLISNSSNLPGTDINIGSGASGFGSSNDPAISTITQIVNLTPTFELLEPIPQVIDGDIRIAIYVENSSQVQIKAHSKTSTKIYELQAEKVSNTNWRVYIPAKSFLAGDYSVRMQATATDGSGVHSFTIGSFTRPELKLAPSSGAADSNTTTVSSSASSTSVSSSIDENVTDTTEVEPTDNQIATSTASTPVPVSETVTQFSITQPNSVISDYEAIRISAPESYSKIEVYARPSLSTQSIFIGSAFKNEGRWSLAFNTNNIPNGTYQLHAVATYQTQRIYSKSVPVSVYNKPRETIKINDPIAGEIKPEPQPTVATSSSPERSFYSYETEAAFVPVSEESKEVEEKTTSIFEEQKDEVNNLLKNYAVVSQSDNNLLNHTINKDFDSVRESILKELISDENNEDQVEQIDNALKARFDELKKRVDAFEDLRSSRTSSDIAKDSDEDGISDFDEVEVYGTDPMNPDTDSDGYLDSIEIVRGFDPLDEQSETGVEFELPQTTVGLVREDILVVKQVRPLIETDESLETPKVQTEITGRGLPNSFVTIYIFSTPTIVTIKTDADGSFTYTFDKELEDGEHEVYVAFTDNTGSIMAHSEPFRFVKEAEAFTPVGAAEDGLVTAPSLIEDSRSQQTNTVIGLGILAFGIILLMLGMGIRTKKTELEQSTI